MNTYGLDKNLNLTKSIKVTLVKSSHYSKDNVLILGHANQGLLIVHRKKNFMMKQMMVICQKKKKG